MPMGRRYSQFHIGDAGQDFGCIGGATDTDLSNLLISRREFLLINTVRKAYEDPINALPTKENFREELGGGLVEAVAELVAPMNLVAEVL